ncbi:MAG: glycosyltransferase [Candidatus Zixiibacteriota bacterium]|nr:MAG: glycosyltransferase [candidate division Zixibacteria bacterium]
MPDFALEPTWILLLLAGGAVYLAVLAQVRRGLGILRRPSAVNGERPAVSVILPCRNEARHLGAALEDLARQDYPAGRLQVIVVDDRSQDGTGDLARGFHGRLADLAVLRVEACPEGLSPKKHALMRGFDAARGDILITTDGDCRFDPGWVTSLVERFAPEVGLVTGLTVFDRGRPEPFWQRVQQLDYLSHSFFAAGAIGRGWAFNCNGSNLALRREAFREAGGYGAIRGVVTGDDTLLLQRLRRNGRWKIVFSADPRSLVRSWPAETPAAVLHQRLRWGSGGLSYAPPALAFAVATFGFFLGLFLSPPLWVAGWIAPLWVLPAALKVAQEGRIMAAGFRTFHRPPDWPAFAVLALLHVPAILSFSLGGHLLGFRWKGERFRRRRSAAPALREARS